MTIDFRLADRVRELICQRASVSGLSLREKQMFGGLAFLVNDKMACGVIDTDLMVRVGKPAYADALSREDVRPMDFTGRPMRGYVFVGSTASGKEDELAYWIGLAITNVATLTARADGR